MPDEKKYADLSQGRGSWATQRVPYGKGDDDPIKTKSLTGHKTGTPADASKDAGKPIGPKYPFTKEALAPTFEPKVGSMKQMRKSIDKQLSAGKPTVKGRTQYAEEKPVAGGGSASKKTSRLGKLGSEFTKMAKFMSPTPHPKEDAMQHGMRSIIHGMIRDAIDKIGK